jgi:hypothetical protein
MTSTAPHPTLDLLLADAIDLRPLLEQGLPEDAAGAAPKPEKTPRGVDAFSLDAPDADPNDMRQQRWAVIAPAGPGGDAALRAIAPLIALREEEQGAGATIYRVPPDMDLEESARWKSNVLRDERIPEAERPRYLLILGDLHEVSAELQHVLANGAFVGRLHIGDGAGGPDAAGYAAYAEKVVRWAREPAKDELPDALFFAAADPSAATVRGRLLLIEPCIEMARKAGAKRCFSSTSIKPLLALTGAGDLLRVGEAARPSVLLSVSHGLGRPGEGWRDVSQQHALQGALLVAGRGGDRLLTAEALRSQPFLAGGLWIAVACFGAGTPRKSAFYPWLSLLSRTGSYHRSLAHVLDSLPRADERPFLAALPQAALANPRGPLAMIAHMDLAWTYGFIDPDRMTQSRASRLFSSLQVMARGSRAGVALDALMRSYREVNDELLADFHAEEDARASNRPSPVDPRRRGRAFMLRNDLRGYMLLGDPAARLPLAGSGAAPAVKAPVAAVQSVTAFAPRGEAAPLETGASVDVARREEAVIAVLRGDESVQQIAERFGVTRATLDRWVEVYRAAGREAIGSVP